MYGCELLPYQLPTFFPIGIFSLEFIRKTLNVAQTHFLPRKKEELFKLKVQVGPFFVNTRAKVKEVEYLLKQIKFKPGVSFPYDPIRNISTIRVPKNSTPYVHVPKSEINFFSNKETWEGNTLQDLLGEQAID